MSRSFNWGIIGPGKIAHQFAQDIQKMRGLASIHAVVSRSEDRAKEFAVTYGATHAFGELDAFLNCPELDAVYIATPHIGHHEYTLKCLRAGIPVLCEKPFAMNAIQAQEMIGVAMQKGVFLMEALWTRFLPTTLKVLELIRMEAIGEVMSVKADFGFQAKYDPNGRIFNPALGGGSLLDIGIYPVFLALLILGKPKQIKAMAKFAETGVDSEMGMLFQYEDGRMAHLHSTLLARTKTEAFIYGTEGTIHMHTRWHESSSMSLIRSDGRPENYHFDWSDNGYGFEAKEVMHCIKEGMVESPIWPLDQSLALMQLLDAIREEIGLKYATDLSD
jgi:predicted dehydrogenase